MFISEILFKTNKIEKNKSRKHATYPLVNDQLVDESPPEDGFIDCTSIWQEKTVYS